MHFCPFYEHYRVSGPEEGHRKQSFAYDHDQAAQDPVTGRLHAPAQDQGADGIGSLILSWRVKSARYWILGSLIMIVCEGLFSMAFFWPRNTIMFIEGTEVHSAAYLRQVAQEFQTLHWARLAFNAAGSASIFVGFLKFYRHTITS